VVRSQQLGPDRAIETPEGVFQLPLPPPGQSRRAALKHTRKGNLRDAAISGENTPPNMRPALTELNGNSQTHPAGRSLSSNSHFLKTASRNPKARAAYYQRFP
jgi:hypothetical protein